MVDQCLGNLSHQKGIGYIWQATQGFATEWCSAAVVVIFPSWSLKALIYLFRYLLKRWSLRKLSVPKWSSGENTLFLFSYFIHLDKQEAESGHFYSKQWEKLPQHLLASGFQLNWCHLFLTSSIIPKLKRLSTG